MKKRPRSSPSRQQRIALTRRNRLEEHGLLGAPAAVQRAYWMRYNVRKRTIPLLGNVAKSLMASSVRRAADAMGPVREAWARVLPAELLGKTQLEGIRAGALCVAADSSATCFVLTRQIEEYLIQGLNAQLGGGRIQRLSVRIGRADLPRESRETE